jgi:3-deoxy-D-manno-octulosonic-acid transferase
MSQDPFPRLLLLPYSLLWLLGLPAVLIRLLWRARRQPEYLRHVRERFGGYNVRAPGAVIWVHAVSLGETRAAEPLVRAVLARWPDHTVVLTHMTPTGREASKALFAEESRVLRVYLPYDFALWVGRFLRHFRPAFGIIMETELWPQLLAACQRRHVPVLLANARMSERSARGYARLPTLTRLTLGALVAIGAQSAADASRLSALGARQVSITGNIKFDISPPDSALVLAERFRARCGARAVILAASTREGEEEAIVDAFIRASSRPGAQADALLVLVPRHPQRFDEVEALVRARGLVVARRSDDAAETAPVPLSPEVRVWLGDSMGEMFAYYAAADIALIGGSWLPFGGQNPIEACAVGTPVLLGPHTFNFDLVAKEAINAGAARRCADIDTAMQAAFGLLADAPARTAMAKAGLAFTAANRGATARTVALLDAVIPPE